jgi:hypothetical protein
VTAASSTSAWIARARALGGSNPVAAIVLVAVNIVPLIGVVLWGWDVGTILITYWLENGVIGLINIPKIMLAGGPGSVGGAVMAGFFAVHYGGFWVGHGIFVFLIAGIASRGLLGFFFGSGFPFGGGFGDLGGFGGFGGFGGPGTGTTGPDGTQILLIVALLFASHGLSFLVNHRGRKEYLNTTPMKQMFQPYGRLIILHITIIIGAFLVIGLGQPVLLVALLVILKTAVDLFFHLREHGGAAPATIV